MPRQPIDDPSLLAAALDGLELQKERIDAQIRQVRALMGVPQRRPHKPARAVAKTTPKRALSAAARKRIALAQKQRWAAFRKQWAVPKQTAK